MSFDDVSTHLEEQVSHAFTEARVGPILEWDDWRGEGVLVESFLERVMVVMLNHDALTLSDISAMRRTMMRLQARRAILYVPTQAAISNPVMLLASLSKIQILRPAPAGLRTEV